MAENKTKPTKVSPAAFIKEVADKRRQKDARELVELIREVTGHAPKMADSLSGDAALGEADDAPGHPS